MSAAATAAPRARDILKRRPHGDRSAPPAIPLLDAFRAEFGETEAGFSGLDYHWTPAGHELASRVIARALRAQGLVPLSPGPD